MPAIGGELPFKLGVISTFLEALLTSRLHHVISRIIERTIMASLSNFLRNLLTVFTARPPAPCCPAAMHWASFR